MGFFHGLLRKPPETAMFVEDDACVLHMMDGFLGNQSQDRIAPGTWGRGGGLCLNEGRCLTK